MGDSLKKILDDYDNEVVNKRRTSDGKDVRLKANKRLKKREAKKAYKDLLLCKINGLHIPIWQPKKLQSKYDCHSDMLLDVDDLMVEKEVSTFIIQVFRDIVYHLSSTHYDICTVYLQDMIDLFINAPTQREKDVLLYLIKSYIRKIV